MDSWLQNLFGWLPGGWLYYTLIGLIAYWESIVGVGLILPGSVLVVFSGFLTVHGKGEILPVMTFGALGAILGDLTSYWLGARFGPGLRQIGPLARRAELFRKAQVFFAAHGGKSIFFGRFLGPLRGFIPFVAGGSLMRPGQFTAYVLISGVLWGLAYPGLGYLGGTSWQRVQQLSGRMSQLFAALLVLLLLNSLFWSKLAPRIGRRLGGLWRRLGDTWDRFLQTPAIDAWIQRHPRLWQFLADRFSLQHGAGLYLTVGFLVSALFATLFLGLVAGLHLQEPLLRMDQGAYQAVQALRHPVTDAFFLTVTYLGSGPVVLMLAGLALTWLILNNRDFSAAILVIGTACGELLVFLLKGIFQRPRPVSFFPDLQVISASFPSAHAFVALVFYGLLVYMLLDTIANWQTRFALVLAGSFIALLIGFSRVYLGVHWLSDVLAGYALAALWLTFLITASEMRRRNAGEFPWRPGWSPLRLSVTVRATIQIFASLTVLGGVVFYLIRKVGQIL